jgi:Protein of unknown function (DUF3622)
MSGGKKYGTRVREESGGFTAEVIRRRTSKGTTVERTRGGFPNNEEAKTWAAAALAEYLALRRQRAAVNRARHRRARERERLRDAWLEVRTLQGLAQTVQGNGEHGGAARELLKSKLESLWAEVAYRVLRNGASEQDACAIANEEVGKNWTERLHKALQGELDRVAKGVSLIALANAQRVLEAGRAKLAGR